MSTLSFQFWRSVSHMIKKCQAFPMLPVFLQRDVSTEDPKVVSVSLEQKDFWHVRHTSSWK